MLFHDTAVSIVWREYWTWAMCSLPSNSMFLWKSLRTVVVVFMGWIGVLFYMVSECPHKLVFQDFGIIRWAGMKKGEKWRKREEEKIESRNPSKGDTYSCIAWVCRVCRWEGGSRKWGECRKLGRLGRLWGTPAKTAFSAWAQDWLVLLFISVLWKLIAHYL